MATYLAFDYGEKRIGTAVGDTLTGTARPLHIGRSTQVWEIRVEDEAGKPVCISRITLAVLPQPPASGKS